MSIDGANGCASSFGGLPWALMGRPITSVTWPPDRVRNDLHASKRLLESDPRSRALFFAGYMRP